MEEKKNTIDIKKLFSKLYSQKKKFMIIWIIVVILSSLWIFPQPRYYTCTVKLAPENVDASLGGLSSLASNVGINIGNVETSDAILPSLYPDLFESSEFIVKLFNINVTTYNGKVSTSYYNYLDKYRKLSPLENVITTITKLVKEKFPGSENENITPKFKGNSERSFILSKKDFKIVNLIQSNISCSSDKKNDVISITVTDQDKLVCAILADSLKERLQNFIIEYRTKKARKDVNYYQHLTDSTKRVYEIAAQKLAVYTDSHRNVVLDTYIQEGNRLKNDVDFKLSTYNAFAAQLTAAKAKLQEKTPSFTTLNSATVPDKPAGPKRMIFIICMLILSSLITSVYILRKEIFGI